MMLEVSPALTGEPLFKITRRKPDQSVRPGIEPVIDSRGGHPERAHIVADHRRVLEALGNVAEGPNAGSIRRSHELISDHARVDTGPEREVAFDASGAWQRPDPAAHRYEFIESVLQVPGEHGLGALSLVRV